MMLPLLVVLFSLHTHQTDARQLVRESEQWTDKQCSTLKDKYAPEYAYFCQRTGKKFKWFVTEDGHAVKCSGHEYMAWTHKGLRRVVNGCPYPEPIRILMD